MTSKRKKFWGSNPKFKQRRTQEVPLGNRFQVLSDLDDDDTSSEAACEPKEFIIKVPPIVVDYCHNFTDVIKFLGNGAKYKRMSVGTKVMANNLVDYDVIVKQLKTKEMTFYTHPVIDQKKFKLILFGLPQLDTKTIFDEFKNTLNIEPISINEIRTTRSNRDDAIYAIEFDRTQITKKEITKIRYLCGIVVHWRNPLRRARGPTQCSKCTMFGHGASNCHRKSVCLGCGGSHDSSMCQLSKTATKTPVIYKCYNCTKKNMKSVNHRADDPKCPSRREYLEIREKITRNSKSIKVRNVSRSFSYSEDDFPHIINNREPMGNNVWPSVSNKETGKFQHRVSMENNQSNTENDISNEQILQIYFDAIDALQKCKNKFDKMRVLGMMLKHVL